VSFAWQPLPIESNTPKDNLLHHFKDDLWRIDKAEIAGRKFLAWALEETAA
jgi:hypothetical protein